MARIESDYVLDRDDVEYLIAAARRGELPSDTGASPELAELLAQIAESDAPRPDLERAARAYGTPPN